MIAILTTQRRNSSGESALPRLPPSSCSSLSSLPLAASAAMKARSRSALRHAFEILLASRQSSTNCAGEGVSDSEGVSEGVSTGVSAGVSEGVSTGDSDGVSDGVSEGVSAVRGGGRERRRRGLQQARTKGRSAPVIYIRRCARASVCVHMRAVCTACALQMAMVLVSVASPHLRVRVKREGAVPAAREAAGDGPMSARPAR